MYFQAIPNSQIEQIARNCRNNIVVVDEAYVDFSTCESAVSLTKKYDNIVVMQTMSKAFGLAGIRCGFAIGHPSVIQIMNNVKAPYNVNKLTSAVARSALEPAAIQKLKTNLKFILKEREYVAAQLRNLPKIVEKVHPSDSNFLLFKLTSHAKEIYKFMAESGCVTRHRGGDMHCENCNR